MIFFVFLSAVFCIPIHLTDENFTTFLNESDRPIFLKLWANWCPHCKDFAPTWDELAVLPDYEEKVYIADIECEENRNSCKSYPGENFPRLYWIDSANQNAITYTGERSMAHFQMFIKKQLHFPILPINESELENYVETANLGSVLLFKLSSSDFSSLQVAQKVATKFRSSELRFIVVENDTQIEPILIAYTEIDRSEKFNGEWNEEQLSQFIYRNSVPYLAEINAYIMKFFVNFNLSTFIRVPNISKPVTPETSEICNDASNYFPVTQTDCYSSPWFCRFVGIGLNNSNDQYVIYNRGMQLFWVFDESENVRKFINEWVIKVSKNLIKPSGPGVGLFSPLFNMYYSQRAQGNPFFVVFIPPVLILILIIYMIYQCAQESKMKND
ncbi:Thioredoxin family protein [Tritrichomonas foetus]|uniref:Thioredoxin family protein n=1 Tax=Tritrichomonas foetus TaxID=1144522 RepID=A0A1J4JTI1_9EUKA|nr:Thioredoxin family protein [Tritrichomonas foetus]|eukprot:OHT02379.1 Thioredoxin family protein [Tritrichomonas foetus]